MPTSIWVIAAGTLAAVLAALMARQLKVSEFRQAWIDGVRADISEFISKAHEWIDLYMDFNKETDQSKKHEMAPNLHRIKYDSFHVLHRVELRFKPNDEYANALLADLRDLLNPGKLMPNQEYSSWRGMADRAVMDARILLKEEWETTKNPFRRSRAIKLRS